MGVTDKAWDGSAGRFSDSEYQSSCVLDRKKCGGDWADKPPKQRCSLPIKEPNGDLNRNGVHAAASRIGSVTDACPEAINAAKAALRAAYKTLGEDAPSSIDPSDSDEGKTPKDTDDKKSSDTDGERREALRAQLPGEWEFRSAEGVDGLGILAGHFAVFNRWTEIDSFWEGRFLERISPGAFTKTIKENQANMRVLFNHGKDPSVGMKILGPIRNLDQDEEGAAYEVVLSDTSFNRDLLPGLRANQYGASFRFQVIREEVNEEPERSKENPDGIPERTITECRVSEFGPVTFPAYADATAGIRSLNGEYGRFRSPKWFKEVANDEQRFAEMAVELDAAVPLLEYLRNRGNDTGEDNNGHESNGREQVPETRAPDAASEENQDQEPTGETSGTAPGNLKRTSTRLPGVTQPLRTSSHKEQPKWRL